MPRREATAFVAAPLSAQRIKIPLGHLRHGITLWGPERDSGPEKDLLTSDCDYALWATLGPSRARRGAFHGDLGQRCQ
jgi:hypothetical protein